MHRPRLRCVVILVITYAARGEHHRLCLNSTGRGVDTARWQLKQEFEGLPPIDYVALIFAIIY